jgi:hypothetical protein
LLEKVHYQPKRDRREKEARTSLSRSVSRKPVLRLISAALQNKPHSGLLHPDEIDDPSPSAA